MLLKLFLAFTVIPALELYLLMNMATRIGALSTLIIVLVTGFLGAWLARMEGWNTWARLQEAVREGRLPADEMLDAVIVVAAAVVLITPGFLTDVAGLALLFPPSRAPVREWLRKSVALRVREASRRPGHRDDDIIIQ
ncbi:MAG: FxsA family protein [bacterium]|nr:FxsA family protein [bacterium]